MADTIASAASKTANRLNAISDADIKASVRHVADDSKAAIDHVADYAADTGVKVRGLVDQTVTRVNDVSGNLENEIRTNPLRSGLIAVGIGFILGALMTKR